MTGVLVVDDSRLMRTVVAGILTDHGYEVGTASDGREAVELVAAADPDVVTMDVEMPEMDGIEATERIMTEHPTPIVMVSAHTETGADATLRALARGAVDFVPKPAIETDLDVGAMSDELIETVETASSADVSAIDPDRVPGARGDDRPPAGEWIGTEDGAEGSSTAGEDRPPVVDVDPDAEPADQPTVVIGASAGGPGVVESILARLPAAIDARVLVVQHMPDEFTGRFAHRLDGASEYAVREASDGAIVRSGEAVVAKGDYHLRAEELDGDGLVLGLDRTDPVHSVRPAIDVTMRSVAETAPPPLVGVVCTGMGRDGAAGIEAIHAAGGTSVVQDPETSPVAGMPRQAIATGRVDEVRPAESIPGAICEAITGSTQPEGVHA